MDGSGRLLYDGIEVRRSIGGRNCDGIDIRWGSDGLFCRVLSEGRPSLRSIAFCTIPRI